MSRLLNTLLIWLCVLSLPVQAMVMAVRDCGASHGGSAVVAKQAVHPCHEMQAADAAEAAGVQEHAVIKKLVAERCSACAACCLGVGMVSPIWHWPGIAPQAAPLVPLVRVLQASFMPELPERPPQAKLA
jgi:hypothetical protein